MRHEESLRWFWNSFRRWLGFTCLAERGALSLRTRILQTERQEASMRFNTSRGLVLLFLCITYCLALTTDAHAYIDLGLGSLAFQALIAGLMAGCFAVSSRGDLRLCQIRWNYTTQLNVRFIRFLVLIEPWLTKSLALFRRYRRKSAINYCLQW